MPANAPSEDELIWSSVVAVTWGKFRAIPQLSVTDPADPPFNLAMSIRLCPRTGVAHFFHLSSDRLDHVTLSELRRKTSTGDL